LAGDERSRRRLLRKVEDYLSDRHSLDLLEKYGRPNRENTHLRIAIHPGSDPSVFELIEQCRDWVSENGFSMEVTTDANILNLH
jgi:hypothetical protein